MKKSSLHIALVYSSKETAQKIIGSPEDSSADDLPPDLLVEYDTEATIAAVAGALSKRYRVTRIEGDGAAYAKLQRAQPDLVFNISEGFIGPNRESHIPLICEALGLACSGSDALTLGICLDKARTKEILSYYRIATPAFCILNPATNGRVPMKLPLPVIVKPLREGSSKGIGNANLITRRDQLQRRVREISCYYGQAALVEEFLPGREFTISVLGNPPDYEILPIAEINHRALPRGANRLYGYEAKWVWDDPASPLPILICPAKISARLAQALRRIVQQTLLAFRVQDWCRVDVRLDAAGRPNILELNPLPGILPDPRDNSAFPAAARAAGYSYDQMILKVAELALRRNQLIP